MSYKNWLLVFSILISTYILSVITAGCAQIGAPTGGTKDTLAPKLIKATPDERTVSFTGNKITFTFDEYIEVQDAFTNLLVSPLPKNNPTVDYKLKTITVKLKDTLLPNTTYSINFGNAIKDVNEGNVFSNFTYVFSTGNTIDSLSLEGKVLMAETGQPDSSLFAMLYRNATDTAVQKRKPDYITRLKGDGSFRFTNLPAGNFKLYALKDGDGGKTYNSKTEIFAFAEKEISVGQKNVATTLYAYAEQKENKTPSAPTAAEKKIKYTTPASSTNQDLLTGLEINFNKPLKLFDSAKIFITDTNYTVVNATYFIDSLRKKISITPQWKEGANYRLIIQNDAVSDSANTMLAKTDTIKFSTKKESEYGNVVLRFANIDFSKHPVLLFMSGEEIKQAIVLTTNEWSKKLFAPGEYELRILYDNNKNGKWDAGNYSKKLQPEIVLPISKKFTIRPNWDNEKEINLSF